MTTTQDDGGQHGGGQPTSPPVPPPGSRRIRVVRVLPSRAGRWLLAAATFVIGLFAGGVVVGFASTGPVTPVVRTVTVTPSPAPSSSSGSRQVTVNAACVQALHDSRAVYALLGELMSAVQSFNPSAVNDIVGQLRPLQDALRNDLGSCRVSGDVSGTPNPSSS